MSDKRRHPYSFTQEKLSDWRGWPTRYRGSPIPGYRGPLRDMNETGASTYCQQSAPSFVSSTSPTCWHMARCSVRTSCTTCFRGTTISTSSSASTTYQRWGVCSTPAEPDTINRSGLWRQKTIGHLLWSYSRWRIRKPGNIVGIGPTLTSHSTRRKTEWCLRIRTVATGRWIEIISFRPCSVL